ncbi:MAG: hypothetical protein JSV68_13795 [Anaerolineaceae bacterium]|nr:MAG: hypothetical protein JSV68_13795 [Anaerolineaceae bacterium]
MKKYLRYFSISCPVGIYIDALKFADVDGTGIVNVICHHNDGTRGQWITKNEPINKKKPTAIHPPTNHDEDWLRGRIWRIEVREKGGYGLIDLRYRMW